MVDLSWRFLRAASTLVARRRLDLRVSGLEYLPTNGPAIIAARHFHHLYDGVAMMATMPRPLHILVGLDWVRNPAGKLAMEQLCRAASWPVVMRRDGEVTVDGASATMALRTAIGDTMQLFEAGHTLLVFPEGYPNIDPGHTPKQDESDVLPFQPGFVRLATVAARRGVRVPIVPAGFSYQRGERWRVHLAFGEPCVVATRTDEHAIGELIEERVRRLSALAD